MIAVDRKARFGKEILRLAAHRPFQPVAASGVLRELVERSICAAVLGG
jgi:hypothetical protein